MRGVTIREFCKKIPFDNSGLKFVADNSIVDVVQRFGLKFADGTIPIDVQQAECDRLKMLPTFFIFDTQFWFARPKQFSDNQQTRQNRTDIEHDMQQAHRIGIKTLHLHYELV